MSADIVWMQHALKLAQYAEQNLQEIPVGSVIVKNNELIAEGWNSSIYSCDPTAHAEIVALRSAGNVLRNYRFPDVTVYITLEPCAMCAMALVHARVARVVYAAPDPKTGAAGSVYDILNSVKNNHQIMVTSGVLAHESEHMLKQFFRSCRDRKRIIKNPKLAF